MGVVPQIDETTCTAIRRVFFSGIGVVRTANAIGCSSTMVYKVVGKNPWKLRSRSARHLTEEDREEISRGIERGESYRSISRRLGRSPSTISREVGRVGARCWYRGWRGELLAKARAARPKTPKLTSNARLRQTVDGLLRKRWSPQQIAERLRSEYPDDPRMRVSHETIYKLLYVQGRGALRAELTRYLRTKRTRRRSRSREQLRSQTRIKDKVMISARPPDIEDRAIPGHWEGDLIVGRNKHTVIGTLVERQSRYLMLVRLPDGKNAEHVRRQLTKHVTKLPEQLRRSLTWDQGTELAQHAQFTVDTGVKVFFCDPHSPWQRGSNENTNGLLRQYFPKGEDFSQYSQAQLDAVARELNGRPRQTLNWLKPCEVFARAVAATD
jgi:IS30 family transposase